MHRPDATQAMRQQLLEIYAEVLRSVNGRQRVRDYLQQRRPSGPHYLVALGKPAWSMAQGAIDVLGDALVQALIITKYGHAEPCHDPRVTLIEAAHPLPDAASLDAGQALLDFIARAEPGVPFVFLIAGGTSSLVEVLSPGMSLMSLAAVNDWLLGAGLDIRAMNRVRKGLSLIKGGRLAQHLCGRPVLNLLLSDVPGDDPGVIGSGLLVSEGSHLVQPDVPAWIRDLITQAPPPPEAADSCFDTIETHILASNTSAVHDAIANAAKHGLACAKRPLYFEGDALLLGRRFAADLLAGPPGFYCWGGESTVHLPHMPGRGGRSQALALAAAARLRGVDGVVVLAVGTDGTDGPTEDAGALVDGGTAERGEEDGLVLEDCLENADSGTFLEASGDLVQTGPTGTNVMDLIMAIKQ